MKVNYIKLGEKANFFFEPASGLKVLPGQVIKIDEEKAKANSRINKALKSGHLEYADESEYDPTKIADYLESLDKVAEGNSELSKDELIEKAIELGASESKSKLKKYSVEELKSYIEQLEDEEVIED
jgi:hypothetical protein